jgi:hypothetical protein
MAGRAAPVGDPVLDDAAGVFEIRYGTVSPVR